MERQTLPTPGQPGYRSEGPETPLAVKLLAIPAVVIFLLAGLWLFAGLIAPGYDSSIALGIVWFFVASFLLGRLTRVRRDLKLPVRATFLVVAIAAGAIFAWTTFRDDEVDEEVVTAAPSAEPAAPADREREAERSPARRNQLVAAGSFRPLAHGPAMGDARMIELADGGRKLTLTNFEVDNGPDLRVYLGANRSGSDPGDFEDLGALKGNKGDQQYDVPKGVDLDRHSTVWIWCRAFSVGFAYAPLSER